MKAIIDPMGHTIYVPDDYPTTRVDFRMKPSNENDYSWNPTNNMKFKIGDKAYKPKGYKFECTIVAIFETTSGEIRIVGEMIDNGMLHIFNESQLEKL